MGLPLTGPLYPRRSTDLLQEELSIKEWIAPLFRPEESERAIEHFKRNLRKSQNGLEDFLATYTAWIQENPDFQPSCEEVLHFVKCMAVILPGENGSRASLFTLLKPILEKFDEFSKKIEMFTFVDTYLSESCRELDLSSFPEWYEIPKTWMLKALLEGSLPADGPALEKERKWFLYIKDKWPSLQIISMWLACKRFANTFNQMPQQENLIDYAFATYTQNFVHNASLVEKLSFGIFDLIFDGDPEALYNQKLLRKYVSAMAFLRRDSFNELLLIAKMLENNPHLTPFTPKVLCYFTSIDVRHMGVKPCVVYAILLCIAQNQFNEVERVYQKWREDPEAEWIHEWFAETQDDVKLAIKVASMMSEKRFGEALLSHFSVANLEGDVASLLPGELLKLIHAYSGFGDFDDVSDFISLLPDLIANTTFYPSNDQLEVLLKPYFRSKYLVIVLRPLVDAIRTCLEDNPDSAQEWKHAIQEELVKAVCTVFKKKINKLRMERRRLLDRNRFGPFPLRWQHHKVEFPILNRAFKDEMLQMFHAELGRLNSIS